jgi:hypothetical protein
LKEAVQRRKIRVLAGSRGSGKTRLIQHMVLNVPDFPKPEDSVMATLLPPPKRSSYVTASEVTCDAFRVMYNQLAIRKPRRPSRKQTPSPTTIDRYFVDAKFHTGFRKVCGLAHDQKTKLFIIDNAHLGDFNTGRWVGNLYNHLGRDCAIILLAEQFPDQTPAAACLELLSGIKGIDDFVLPPLELECVTSVDTFRDTVMPRLLGQNNLFADFDDTLWKDYNDICADLHRETNGNWYRIDDTLAETLYRSLTEQDLRNERGARIITREVLDQVLRALRAAEATEKRKAQATADDRGDTGGKPDNADGTTSGADETTGTDETRTDEQPSTVCGCMNNMTKPC